MNVVNLMLTGVAWILIEVLLVVLYRIARFYQITSGQASHYRLFLLPILCWGGAVLLAALQNEALIVVSDTLMIVGGLSVIGLSYWLLKLMTGDRS